MPQRQKAATDPDTMAGKPRQDTLNDQHRASYDAVAARFAAVNAAMPAAVLAAAAAFLDTLALVPDTEAPVLDLGCGHGRDAAWFEAQGVRVVGADLSGGMLAVARGFVQGSLVQADMRCLPFSSGSFAGIWCNAALLHLPKAAAPSALGEIRRILVPGGIFDVAVQVGEGEAWETWSYEQQVPRFFARYRPREFAALLAEARFEILSEDESDGVPGRHWVHFSARR